jgi:hypothetical protein
MTGGAFVNLQPFFYSRSLNPLTKKRVGTNEKDSNKMVKRCFGLITKCFLPPFLVVCNPGEKFDGGTCRDRVDQGLPGVL